ncbi:MAG: tetratricopeptide repeat protein [Thermoanaerobaculales bacterium]|nr:tetratricopeptide repeat protein [Thermoanaerobaculales bacterium]
MLFSNVDIGSVLPNPTLPGLDGVERSLLSEDQVSAFVFIHPEQEHSLEVLRDLVELRKEMVEKPVRWIGVVSDRFSEDSMRSALSEAGLEWETIIDKGDLLYGELGVRLYPSIGVADREGNLRAYLPYTKVNFMRSVQVHLLHTLGEIDDEELKAALRPKSVDFGGNGAAAGRNIRFARMLLDAGKLDKALAKARDVVTASPDSAEAHALVGFILVQQGQCDAAQESLQRALELDPKNVTAKTARDQCG